MQGESAATAGYHSANAAVTQNEDQMAQSTIGALSNLATATSSDRSIVAALTQEKFSSRKTTGGQLLRVEGIEGFAQSGMA
jgi:hypothetical protein